MRSFIVVALMIAAAAQAAEEGACAQCDAAIGPAISIDGTYLAEKWHGFAGDFNVDERYLDNLTVSVALDGAAWPGFEGWQFFATGLYNNGSELADESNGTLQGISNIETAPGVARLYEMWLQWHLGSADNSLRFGLYDLNSEFDHIEAASLFLNPSHGIGPDFSQSGENGPSIFPITSLALRAHWGMGPWHMQTAVLDAKPGDAERPWRAGVSLSGREGLLIVTETGYDLESGARAGIGYWRYTSDFDDVSRLDADGNPHRRDDNTGGYFLVQSAPLFRRGTEDGLSLFARTGFAQDHINTISRYYGAGAVYSAAASRWWPQQIGLAIAIAQLGAAARNSLLEAGEAPAHNEFNYELTCRYALSEQIAVQADAQYIANPGASALRDSALLVGIRIEVALQWSR